MTNRTAKTRHTRRQNPMGIAAAALIAGAVIATGGTANAAVIPEEDMGVCPSGTYLQVAHCEPDPTAELSGALSSWFGHLAGKANGQ